MITRSTVALALCLAATQTSAAQKEFHASRSETVTAKVESVDQKTREVTLVGQDGAKTTVKAGDQVRNLNQVKPGDVVTAKVDQSVTLWLLAPGENPPDLAGGADVTRAPAGAKPGGTVNADVSGVATVEAIAPDKKSVTLKGPRGNSVKLAVANPKNLEGVKVGTRVGFLYSESLAIAVAPGKKKK